MSKTVHRGRTCLTSFLLLTALLVCGCGAVPAMAQAPGTDVICQQRCTPRKQVQPFVEIDANTGALIGGTNTFADGEKLKVIVSGKNPYKYDYRTSVKSEPLEVSLFSSFLGLIPGADLLAGIFDSTGLKGVAAQRALLGGPAGAPPPPSRCQPERLTELADLILKNQALGTQIDALKTEAAPIVDSNDQYKKILLATDKTSLGSPDECKTICVEAAQALPLLDRLSNVSTFEANVKKLQASSKDVGDKTSALRKAASAECVNEIKDRLEPIEENAKTSRDQAEAGLAIVEEIKKAKPAVALLKQRIQKTLTDEDAFSEERFPYTQAGPTAVKVTLTRKNLREENAQEKEIAQVDLTVGRSRFSLTAGVGFSTIQDVTVVRQGNKFGEENQSDLRPSLAVMLNTQLGQFYKKVLVEKGATETVRQHYAVSGGMALGLVLTQRNNTTEVEFIAGPSFGFLDDKFVVVLGYHTARVQSLGGGFKVGQDIPADLKDLPVDRDWASGVMLAFTYKFR